MVTLLQLYCDGACEPNPGPGGWAYAVVQNGKLLTEGSGAHPSTTNNRMEMQAAIAGLTAALSNRNAAIRVFSDSKYLVNGASIWSQNWKKKGWKIKGKHGNPPSEVKNRDLWELIDSVTTYRIVEWTWIRGHNGNFWNEHCDVAAVAAMNAIRFPPQERTSAGGERARAGQSIPIEGDYSI